MSSTSHYEVYGTLPTLTEQEKQDILTSKELPGVSSADNGKALIVDGGKWSKKAIPSQLPSVDAEDNGKVLTVSAGEWVAAAIPNAGAETKGVVLLAENVANSEAETLAALVTSFNALLASLKAAGIMAADEETEET